MIIRVFDRQLKPLHQQESEWTPFEEDIRVWDELKNDTIIVGRRQGERLMIWPATGESGIIHVVSYGDDSMTDMNINHSPSDTFALSRREQTFWLRNGQRKYNKYRAAQGLTKV